MKRRLVNPGRRNPGRRRKLTAKQIKYFGTPQQKAALRRKRRGNPSARKTKKRMGSSFWYGAGINERVKAKRRVTRKRRARRAAMGNVGEIITVNLDSGRSRRGYLDDDENEGRSSNPMARRRRRSSGSRRRRVTRRRRSNYGLRARRANPSRRRYTRRRRNSALLANPRRRRSYTRRRRRSYAVGGRRRRRSNPGLFSGGILTGTTGMVIGLLGGAALTKVVHDRLPNALRTGIMGYVSTAVIGVLSGQLVGKFSGNRQLGNNMRNGAFLLLGLQLASDFIPGVSGILPFGLRGLGILSPSSFYVPQVPLPGSMSSFVLPSAVGAAMVPANATVGLGGLARRTPRMGRFQ